MEEEPRNYYKEVAQVYKEKYMRVLESIRKIHER